MDSFIFKSAGLGGPGGAAAGAGGAMLAAVAILTPLPFQSRVSVGRGLALFSMGLVHYTLLFSFCSSLLLRYKHLSTAALLDISNKVVSALQAVVATGIGAAVCTHSCPRDLLTTSTVLSDAYAWFGAAYFFYDIWSMYIVHVENAREAALTGGSISSQTVETDEPEGQDAAGGVRGVATGGVGDQTTLRAFLKHEPLMVAHHIFVGGFGFLVIVYLRKNLGDCVFGFVYLMELSTPCVCIRGALARLGQRSSRLYAANGAAMLATFLLCRLAAPPYAMLLYARSKKLPLPQAMAGLPLGCKLSIMALMLPQYYWFYLMCRGAIKLFLPAKSSSTEIVNKDQENNKTDNKIENNKTDNDQVNKVEVVASLRQVYRASDVIEADKPTVPCFPTADRKLKQS